LILSVATSGKESGLAPADGPHLDKSQKMGAPGLDFQTWDSVDTRLAKELGIEVSHVSESRHGAPNILSIRIGPVNALHVTNLVDGIGGRTRAR
jgi:hypothetical protein